jgi:RND family efflux transporter MFP subunit
MRRAVVPFAIVGLSVLLAWGLVLRGRQPIADVVVDLRPWVEVVRVEPQSLHLSVRAQGTVQPRMEAELVAEIGGRVIAINAALAAGGFFEAGDELVRFDARDYEAVVERAGAAVARAASELQVRNKAHQRMESLAREKLTSDSVLDDAQNALHIARANLADAEAQLKRANLDLERTIVRAPFVGRVRD